MGSASGISQGLRKWGSKVTLHKRNCEYKVLQGGKRVTIETMVVVVKRREKNTTEEK